MANFKVGFILGMTTVLIFVISLTASHVQIPLSWQITVRLFRAPALVTVYLFMISGNIYTWKAAGTDRAAIFNTDSTSQLRYIDMLQVGGLFAVAWGIGMILYLFSPILGIPLLIHPLWIYGFMLIYLLNPFPVLHYRSRRWLLMKLLHVVTTPLGEVSFADSWIADQLNSLSLVIVDLQYVLCFYINEVEWTGFNAVRGTKMVATCDDGRVLTCSVSGNQSYINPCIDRLGDPNNSLCRAIDDQCYTDQYAIRHLLTALPAFWRFVQCWRCFYDSRRSFRHIVNAFKYSMCFIVLTFSTLNIWYKVQNLHSNSLNEAPKITKDKDVLFVGTGLYMTPENVFFRLWIIAAIVNTLYTYIWDIKMDWGLLARDASGNKFLRANILYKYKAFYYFAMAEDLILRLTWTLSMTVAETRAIDSEVLRTLLGFLEITRRSIWNFLRVEVEQIKIMSSSAKCSSSDNMEGELYGDEKITEVDGDKGVTNEAYSEESVTEEKQSSSSTTEEYRNKFRCSLWIARHWNESSYRQS